MRWAILVLLLVVGCTAPQIEDWDSDAAGAAGFDIEILSQVRKITARERIHSFVVARGEIIILEHYTDSNSLRRTQSCAKSVTSLLVGIAIDQGHIQGPEQSIGDFFPRLKEADTDPAKQGITIAHLLNMTAGLDWPEWTEWNFSSDPMKRSSNWVDFILNRPMSSPPGTVFNYSTGNTHLLSAIIQEQTGMTLANYAEAYLFGPLGITEYYWLHDPQGYTSGGSDLSLQARDMIKLGQLVLNGGEWEGKQVVPRDWVEQSITLQSAAVPFIGSGYGYGWWRDHVEPEAWFAMGGGGQFIYIVPEYDLVVSTNAWIPENTMYPMQYIHDYVLKAIVK